MPKNNPIVSFERIREYAERWEWTVPSTGMLTIGYNPPKNAIKPHRVPFHLKAVSIHGEKYDCTCVCLKVDRRNGRRQIMIQPSGEIRWVQDMLIQEIDGVRFVAH